MGGVVALINPYELALVDDNPLFAILAGHRPFNRRGGEMFGAMRTLSRNLRQAHQRSDKGHEQPRESKRDADDRADTREADEQTEDDEPDAAPQASKEARCCAKGFVAFGSSDPSFLGSLGLLEI